MKKYCPLCKKRFPDDDLTCSERACNKKNGLQYLVEEDNEKIEAILDNTKTKLMSFENSNEKHTSRTNTVQKIKVNLRGNKTLSDCEDFMIEWDKGSSVFLESISSSFRFKLSPITKEAKKAANIRFFLRLPENQTYTEYKQNFLSLKQTKHININYTPSANCVGPHQGVDFYFIYSVNNEEKCFSSQLLINIYPNKTSANVETLNFYITGHANDIEIPKDIKSTKELRGFELLQKLQKDHQQWEEIELSVASELSTTHIYIKIPPPPEGEKYSKIIIRTIENKLIFLYLKPLISLGRSRANIDIITRNQGTPGTRVWSAEMAQERNLQISNKHCTLEIADNALMIQDYSQNGTYIDKTRVSPDEPLDILSLEVKKFSLSLAPSRIYPCNFLLDVDILPLNLTLKNIPSELKANIDPKSQILAACILKRTDKIPETYLLMNKWMQLSNLIKNVPAMWILCKKDSLFAVTDGKQWHWLTKGKKLPLTTGILEVI